MAPNNRSLYASLLAVAVVSINDLFTALPALFQPNLPNAIAEIPLNR